MYVINKENQLVPDFREIAKKQASELLCEAGALLVKAHSLFQKRNDISLTYREFKEMLHQQIEGIKNQVVRQLELLDDALDALDVVCKAPFPLLDMQRAVAVIRLRQIGELRKSLQAFPQLITSM